VPSVQRGTVVKRGETWQARWYDEAGQRRSQGGFATKTAAREWVDDKVDEIAALRRGDVAALRRRQMLTLGELVEEFKAQHVAEPTTVEGLSFRLRYALEGPKLDGRGGWSDLPVERLSAVEIGRWRKQLPARSAHGIHKSLRQVLHYGVRTKLLLDNAAAMISNPVPKRAPVATFDLDELDLIGAELPKEYRAVPVFAALTGLRPCEWMALDRRDVDQKAGVVSVRKTIVDGRLKPYGKTSRSVRTVPLPERAALALKAATTRIDSPVLFPAPRGGYTDLQNWRWRCWEPAFTAADVPYRHPYALTHTYASLSIAAGVTLFELSRFMGSSVAQIDSTYGHLLPDAVDRTRAALDAFVCPISAQTSENAVAEA
jgi:integrase